MPRKESKVQFSLTNGQTNSEIIQDNHEEEEDTDDYLTSLNNDEDEDEDEDEDTSPGILMSSHVFSSFPLGIKLDPRQVMLFEAVESNDLEKVRGLICGELPAPDVNGINLQRRSPLIAAIRAKHLGK